jgi:hypothetical protein
MAMERLTTAYVMVENERGHIAENKRENYDSKFKAYHYQMSLYKVRVAEMANRYSWEATSWMGGLIRSQSPKLLTVDDSLSKCFREKSLTSDEWSRITSYKPFIPNTPFNFTY